MLTLPPLKPVSVTPYDEFDTAGSLYRDLPWWIRHKAEPVERVDEWLRGAEALQPKQGRFKIAEVGEFTTSAGDW